jgi:hypothetical protein
MPAGTVFPFLFYPFLFFPFHFLPGHQVPAVHSMAWCNVQRQNQPPLLPTYQKAIEAFQRLPRNLNGTTPKSEHVQRILQSAIRTLFAGGSLAMSDMRPSSPSILSCMGACKGQSNRPIKAHQHPEALKPHCGQGRSPRPATEATRATQTLCEDTKYLSNFEDGLMGKRFTSPSGPRNRGCAASRCCSLIPPPATQSRSRDANQYMHRSTAAGQIPRKPTKWLLLHARKWHGSSCTLSRSCSPTGE